MTTDPPQHASASSSRKLIPVRKWPLYHDWPSIGGLRHLIFNAQRNGFDRVVRRVGGRVLIDEAAFFTWVDEQAQRAR